ncbi:MAG: hypothetical protein LBQ24_06365 [Candidatus Peribacteria bacterium]|nr:hypothetical protein [Candidatus Peribacteria bacterium]
MYKSLENSIQRASLNFSIFSGLQGLTHSKKYTQLFFLNSINSDNISS